MVMRAPLYILTFEGYTGLRNYGRIRWIHFSYKLFSSISGSIESPLSASPIQSYHQSSTYFYQNCQWFFDPPPARELLMKISTTQTMGKLHHQNFNGLNNK